MNRSHIISSDVIKLGEVRDIYKQCFALNQFTHLNKEGFRKIVKKFDKVLGLTSLDLFMDTLRGKTAFMKEEEEEEEIGTLEKLLEEITNLVSRDKLIDLEQLKRGEEGLSSAQKFDDLHLPSSSPPPTISLLITLKATFPSLKPISLSFSLLLFVGCVIFHPLHWGQRDLNEEDKLIDNAFATFVFSISLFVTEAIPYFVTGIFIHLFDS